MITAFVGVLLAIVGGVLGSQRPIVFLVCIPAAVVMLLLSVIGFFVIPQFETPSSAEFVSHMKGLIRAMDTDAAALRREFAQRSGLSPAAVFATMLPLAVVFELENSWTGAFPDVSDDDLRAVGWGFVPMGSISNSIDSAVDILSTVSEAPSSSDGGGSSGGGGGGGGGGSW